MMITSYVGIAQNRESENKIKITNDHLDEIEKAISVFYRQNGFIPCPAGRTAAINTATFGTSENCAAAVVDTFEIGAVRIGVVPTRTLSISDKYMYDGWNNRIKYTVIRDLARTSTMYNNYATTLPRVITIQDAAGTAINPLNTNHTAYVLVSHGKDGSGARNFLGTAIPAGCLANQDNENCDDDTIFRFQPSNDASGTASYFDDIIRWKTISDTRNTQILGGGAAVATNGIAALKIGIFNTGSFNGDTSVAGCGSNCKQEPITGSVLNMVSLNFPIWSIGAGTIGLSGGSRYIIKMSTPFCGVGRGVGLMYTSTGVPPIQQVGRHFASFSLENTVTGTHRCSRSTAIAYVNLPFGAAINFGRYMDNLTPNAATYHFGISYQFNPLISNNTTYFPQYEYVQIEVLRLD